MEVIMNTVLCYLEKDGQYLMLHRNKKANDLNAGKWIGVGGKLEAGEAPEEALVREVREETGLTLTRFHNRGLVTFVSGDFTEYMHLFTADQWEGTLIACDEGTLRWVAKSQVLSLPLWEGDVHFLRLLAEDTPWFSLKLRYEGDRLAEWRRF
ncbi:MAG: 8-oxo-dGTP diphosphatase [Clostridia bacterium]|nr:8-oxo-dGTP diphosphatase [Clostridia bacterium]